MTDQELIIACAELDGRLEQVDYYFTHWPTQIDYCLRALDERGLNYIHSYYAIIPAIARWCGKDTIKIADFITTLHWTVFGKNKDTYNPALDSFEMYMQSTPKQLATAWVKAGGLWKD